MKIECEKDPWDLIGSIGNSNFSICDETYDETYDEIYRHDNHPHWLRIIDCENETTIDVRGSSIEDTHRIAENLVLLLNQTYTAPGKRE